MAGRRGVTVEWHLNECRYSILPTRRSCVPILEPPRYRYPIAPGRSQALGLGPRVGIVPQIPFEALDEPEMPMGRNRPTFRTLAAAAWGLGRAGRPAAAPCNALETYSTPG